jgi:hypothetical protein
VPSTDLVTSVSSSGVRWATITACVGSVVGPPYFFCGMSVTAVGPMPVNCTITSPSFAQT